MTSIIQLSLWVIVIFKQPQSIIVPPRQTQALTPMLATTLKTKSSYQAIKTILTQVMVSQLKLLQQIPDIAELPTGQELEAFTITQTAILLSIMVGIGLVLLTVTSPPSRVLSTPLAASATTSSIRAPVCVPAFRSRLRSSQSNNQKIQTRLWI